MATIHEPIVQESKAKLERITPYGEIQRDIANERHTRQMLTVAILAAVFVVGVTAGWLAAMVSRLG